MPSPELEQAWQAALTAPAEDVGAWRVLADVLLGAGDPRGEWLQLELDAEAGPLKGLSRGRLPQLREELLPRLLPAGVDVTTARSWRTVFVGGRLHISRAGDPHDPRWSTVRRLSFFIERRYPTLAQWRRTPLVRPLTSLESVAELEQDAVPLLAEGPVFPRLRRLWTLWPVGRGERVDAAAFERLWDAVLTRQPSVREVHLGWPGPLEVAEPYVAPLLRRGLERVGVEGSSDEVATFHRWVPSTGFRGEFVVELRRADLSRATVVVGRDELVLRCGKHAVETAMRSLRGSYEWRGPMPPVRVEGPAEGLEKVPPPM